jgi:hypothetical protein
MAIQKGWVFSSQHGFTGSAGKAPVKGYMRGGHVKSEHRHMAHGGKPKLGSGERFAALKSKLSHEKGVTNPGALAASIGRKKYGEKKMASMSAKGRMHKAIGGLVTKGELDPPSRETVKPGGAQQFARGGHVVSFYARGGHVRKGMGNDVGLPKKAPRPFPNVRGPSKVKPGGKLQFAKGGLMKGQETLGRDYETPAKGKFADYKRGGMHKRGGGRC